jgi:hypothetical protein
MKLFLIILSVSIIQLSFAQDKSNFIKDIPHYKSGIPSIYYSSVRKTEKIIKLDTIENGFDSLQIRIWYHYPKFEPAKKILILKNKNKIWTASLYDYDKDSIIILNCKDLNGFMNNLFSCQLMTLPDMNAIKGLEDHWKDGDSYTVEISDKKHYRLYNYHVPEEFQHKFRQAKDMVRILKLIKKEFNIPLAHWD